LTTLLAVGHGSVMLFAIGHGYVIFVKWRLKLGTVLCSSDNGIKSCVPDFTVMCHRNKNVQMFHMFQIKLSMSGDPGI